MLAANSPAVFPHFQLPRPPYPLSFSSLLYCDTAFSYIIQIALVGKLKPDYRSLESPCHFKERCKQSSDRLVLWKVDSNDSMKDELAGEEHFGS